MTFEELIGPLLEREGGYVNHKNDRGGATNYGITQRVYSDWKGEPLADVKAMQKYEAKQIYFELYWKPAKCELLPNVIREIHFDAAVNHGMGRAAKLLQVAAAVAVDGVIGKNTLAAAGATHPELLKFRYVAARYKFYGDIIRRDRSQLEFMAGWMARMDHFI